MECSLENFDDSIKHKKKRQLKGQRRIEISRDMLDRNILPSLWRHNEADSIMETLNHHIYLKQMFYVR